MMCNKYIEKLRTGDKKTLFDAQTKLFIIAKEDIYLVKVDNGIIQNERDGIKKCDYLIFDKNNLETHLIELKGAEIKKAFEQLKETIVNLGCSDDYKFLINGLSKADAFIVSPCRRNIPDGIESRERKVASILAKKCQNRPKNIMELLKYIRVVSNINKLPTKKQTREIQCSGKYPLQIPLPFD